MFRLELSNGQNWNITAEEPVSSWAQRLAGILQLPEGEMKGCPRLIFRKRGPRAQIAPLENWASLHLEEIIIRSHPDTAEVVCEVQSDNPDVMGIWESVFPIYSRAQDSGGLPVHAGLIEKNGVGVLLGGISDSGKSTCCRRLPPPWKALCDEEVLVLLDPEQECYRAHPFPTWSLFKKATDPLSWDVRKPVPVKAIFFIEKFETDSVRALGRGSTAMRIFSLADEKCHLDWERIGRQERMSRREKLFENACRMAERVPGYILRVSRSGRFWVKMDEVLAHD